MAAINPLQGPHPAGFASPLQPLSPDALPLPVVLLDLLCGMMKTQALHHAARLGLADLVQDGPRSVAILAELTHTHASALSRLMAALAGMGVFEEVSPGLYGQTPLSALLRADTSGSMRDVALLHGTYWQWHVWEGFASSLETGQTAFDLLFGEDMWTYLTHRRPEEGHAFNAAMTGFSEQVNAPLAQAAYDFDALETIVDLGGGQGTFLRTLLTAHLGIRRGILFDRPSVIATAQSTFAQAGLAGRYELQAGDFFEAVPVGADAYFLKQIIKDWDDAACVQILRACRHAMKPHGRILVAEVVLRPGRETALQKLIDLQLLLLASGKERTEAQYRALFAQAGLRLARVIPTHSPYSLLEGVADERGR